MFKNGKLFGIIAVLILTLPAICSAESWDLNLSAGGDSIIGGIHYKSYLETGYFRIGGSGVFVSEDDSDFSLGQADFTVGSDTMMPGLNVDVGLSAVMGTASDDDDDTSGDVGAVGFLVSMNYLFPPEMIPIPLEIFGGATWAPGPLSFADTENYREIQAGVGVRIIKNASIIFTYRNYHIEMEKDKEDWDFDHGTYQIGIVMRF